MEQSSLFTAGLIAIGFLVAFVAIYVVFLLTQYRTLKIIRLENREMNPNHVWLQLIPVAGFFFSFYIVMKLSDSIRNELSIPESFSFETETQPVTLINERPTLYTGLAFAAMFVLQMLPLAMLKSIFSLLGIVFWIAYWVQLNQSKQKIRHLQRDRAIPS
jgi:hypothetical protein